VFVWLLARPLVEVSVSSPVPEATDTKATRHEDLNHDWPTRESWLVTLASDWSDDPPRICMMKAEDDRKDDVSIEVTLPYEPSSRRLSVSAVPRPNKDKLTFMIVLIDGYAAMRLDTAFYAGVSSGDPNDPPAPI
jgi:hypothetical protein